MGTSDFGDNKRPDGGLTESCDLAQRPVLMQFQTELRFYTINTFGIKFQLL